MMLETIQKAWAWLNIEPKQVVTTNDFGNVIFLAEEESYWQICPEELTCEKIAESEEQFHAIWKTNEFKEDCLMDKLVAIAIDSLGPLLESHCYCLKIPAVLGGTYDIENISMISRKELIMFAGDLAKQIKNLSDGENIKIEFPW